MADQFKKIMHQRTGKGGIFCDCCNCYHGKEKPILNKLARSRMKSSLNKEILSEISDMNNYDIWFEEENWPAWDYWDECKNKIGRASCRERV
jgi:hypothetical protein